MQKKIDKATGITFIVLIVVAAATAFVIGEVIEHSHSEFVTGLILMEILAIIVGLVVIKIGSWISKGKDVVDKSRLSSLQNDLTALQTKYDNEVNQIDSQIDFFNTKHNIINKR